MTPFRGDGHPIWGAMAITEPQAGSDAAAIEATADLDPETNEYVINGNKIFCTAGEGASQVEGGFVVERFRDEVPPVLGRKGLPAQSWRFAGVPDRLRVAGAHEVPSLLSQVRKDAALGPWPSPHAAQSDSRRTSRRSPLLRGSTRGCQ